MGQQSKAKKQRREERQFEASGPHVSGDYEIRPWFSPEGRAVLRFAKELRRKAYLESGVVSRPATIKHTIVYDRPVGINLD